MITERLGRYALSEFSLSCSALMGSNDVLRIWNDHRRSEKLMAEKDLKLISESIPVDHGSNERNVILMRN
jgi:hypothetical protein